MTYPTRNKKCYHSLCLLCCEQVRQSSYEPGCWKENGWIRNQTLPLTLLRRKLLRLSFIIRLGLKGPLLSSQNEEFILLREHGYLEPIFPL